MKQRDERRKGELYLTTGEIPALLGNIISQTTVSRLFDRGELGGRVNPLTGRREIEWGSVLEWLRGKGLSEDKIGLVDKKRGKQWKRLKRIGGK